MIEIFSDGKIIGVSLSGWTTVAFIIYIVLIFINWSLTNVTLIRKLIILYNVRKRIRSKIPFWWKFSKVIYNYILIYKDKDRYIIPIEVKCNLSGKKTFTVRTFFHMYSNGIYDTDVGTDYLLSMIKKIDTINKIDYKQMHRDKKLNDLGI
jgi:Na+-transporting NADH:ubiquinone oxidoreductase subunit NqrE